MLSKKILSLVNDQIWLENNASFYYLRLSIEFNNKGFSGISTFFLNQSQEERDTYDKINNVCNGERLFSCPTPI